MRNTIAYEHKTVLLDTIYIPYVVMPIELIFKTEVVFESSRDEEDLFAYAIRSVRDWIISKFPMHSPNTVGPLNKTYKSLMMLISLIHEKPKGKIINIYIATILHRTLLYKNTNLSA